MKILVIQTAFPGDAILTLPMIQKLAEVSADSVIDVLAIPATELIFRYSKSVKEVIVYDKKGKDKTFGAFIALAKRLRAKNYDIVISPHRSSRSAILAFLSGAKKTISFDKSSLSFLYKERKHYDPDVHEVKRNLNLIDYEVTGDNWKVLPELSIPPEIENKVKSRLDGFTGDIIAIAPGSVWATKKYPLEYFSEIISSVVDKNYKVVVVGGKTDEDLGRSLEKVNPEKVKSFAGAFDFAESIALLKCCRLLVSNDSAPTHMGMVADIPVLTIYCSTIPGFGFYPYNSISKFVSYDELECKPCGIHGYKECPEGHFNCGYKLLPSVILEAMTEILAGDIH